MDLQELSEIIIRASIAIYDIGGNDVNLTAELKDGRTINIEITMEVEDEG